MERRLTRVVWTLGAAQPVAGALTVVLLHPTGLRLLHIALADLLWLATLFLWSTHVERTAAAAGHDVDPGRRHGAG